MFEPVVQLIVNDAAVWQHWIMFKFKETVKTNQGSCYFVCLDGPV